MSKPFRLLMVFILLLVAGTSVFGAEKSKKATAVSPNLGSSSSRSVKDVTLKAGHLFLTLDKKGQISRLVDDRSKMLNYMHPTRSTNLMCIKLYDSKAFLAPVSCKIIKTEKGVTSFLLSYPKEITATIAITPKQGWFRMELVAAHGLANIDTVIWGPINTRCEGPVGAFFGLVRNDDSTLGMMSLEPNTDGLKIPYAEAAFWLPWKDGGSYLELVSQDHTRKRSQGFIRSSIPEPGLTPVGSAVALYSSPQGRELDLIEKIVIAEKLPYPQHQGVWSKRSKAVLRPGIWGRFDHKNIDSYFDLAVDFHGGEICAFHNMFGNWGHFDIDPKLYPKGMNDIRAAVQRGRKKGIGLTMYTITNFTRPRSKVEPYISPIPDPGFLCYDTETTLLKKCDDQANTVTLAYSETFAKLLESLRKNKRGVLWIDNEYIYAHQFRLEDGWIVMEGAKRGYMKTLPKPHAANARVRIVYYGPGYQSIYPGTLELSNEIAANIGRVCRDGGFSKVTFDGHESALHTGHGVYAMNKTCKIVYDANNERTPIITGSRITNYCWHMITYISWGEHDMHKGFRGSMLDYRLRRQDQLSRALMPHKMGQHYPDRASAEDMNWLCGLAAGWDSGLELSVNASKFNNKEDREEILKIVALWEKARLFGKLTTDQKMHLRQVDCEYRIREEPDGTFDIALHNRWRHEGVELLPPSTIQLENLKECKVEPIGIDFDWLHCPLVAVSAALSDDIVLCSNKESSVSVFYPGPDMGGRERQAFQCVLRVPKNAKAGILNPRFTTNRKTFVVPTEIKPGQYLAFTADLAIVHLYGAGHQLIRDIPIRHLNDLPGVPRGKPFDVHVFLPSAQKGIVSEARMNLYNFQPIRKP